MGIEKKVYSFRLDESLVERLKEYAFLQNRTLSNLVETVLKEEVEKPVAMANEKSNDLK